MSWSWIRAEAQLAGRQTQTVLCGVRKHQPPAELLDSVASLGAVEGLATIVDGAVGASVGWMPVTSEGELGAASLLDDALVVIVLEAVVPADELEDGVVGSSVGAVGVTVGVMMVELGVGAEVGDIGGVTVVLGADVGVVCGAVGVEAVGGGVADSDDVGVVGVDAVVGVVVGRVLVGADVDEGALEDDVLDVGTGLPAVGPDVPGVVGRPEGTKDSVGRLGTRAASEAPGATGAGITHGTGCATDSMSLVE